jgi:molybdopterin synthase catalytic subunit
VTPRIHTDLSDRPLELGAAHAFAGDPGAGAVVVFAGTVREQTDERAVSRLEYEAYAERAREQLAELAADVARRWPVCAVWLEHRVGTLAVGEPAVVVAVSAAHRPAAFDAARYAIDTLKATAAIWKKEHWADGDARWVDSP